MVWQDCRGRSVPFFCALLVSGAALLIAGVWKRSAQAQPGAVANPAGPAANGVQGNVGFGPGAGPAANVFGGGNGGAGGAANADFDSLIDLITSTVDADGWVDAGTGQGEIQPFPTGVYVDANGALSIRRGAANAQLERVAGQLPARRGAIDSADGRSRDPADGEPNARAASALRFISLPRLELAIAARQAAREPLDPAMLTLAGLQRIEFVAVDPESGDLVLAGPAGDWRAHRGALLSVDTGQPVVRLDDLLTLLRRRAAEGATPFGCAIVPKQQALAATQDYLARTGAKPLPRGGRGQWLAELRDTLGEQDVEFYHLDSSTRIARLILAADYHMKLVGMGLAKGVPGVRSYLDGVRLGPDGQPPAMSVIRWWFSMPTSTVEASADGRAFALPANCVEVLSENELLAARGERVHTGESDELTGGFARAFTKHFDELAAKYPVYGELQRVFELALALAVIEQQGLLQQAAWTPEHLLNPAHLRLPRVTTPQTVETVVNHRVIGGRHVIAGISGGVWLDPAKQLRLKPAAVALPQLAERPIAASADAGEPVWWWDDSADQSAE